MKRIIRDRKLTPKEAAKYNTIREQAKKDFPPANSRKPEKEPFEVDDRGNVAQFYDVRNDEGCSEVIATLDREAGPDANESTWDGNEEVTEWAEKHGYPDIRSIQRADR